MIEIKFRGNLFTHYKLGISLENRCSTRTIPPMVDFNFPCMRNEIQSGLVDFPSGIYIFFWNGPWEMVHFLWETSSFPRGMFDSHGILMWILYSKSHDMFSPSNVKFMGYFCKVLYPFIACFRHMLMHRPET